MVEVMRIVSIGSVLDAYPVTGLWKGEAQHPAPGVSHARASQKVKFLHLCEGFRARVR